MYTDPFMSNSLGSNRVETPTDQTTTMLRKVIGWPEAVAHYSVGSVLLVTHLCTVGIRLRRRPAHG